MMLAAILVAGCSQFVTLKQELDVLQSQYAQYDVHIENSPSNAPIVLVLLKHPDAKEIDGFDVMLGDEDIQLQAYIDSQFLFVFIDENHDLRFQPNEQYEWLKLPNHDASQSLTLTLNNTAQDYPQQLVDKPLQTITNMKISQARFDEVITLADPIFNRQHAKMGMWQPISHIEQGNTGLFFTAPYDANKIPVVFVHGMGGSGVDFEPLIANLDQSKYQIWIFNYPSGLPVLMVAKGLDNLINIINAKYDFSQAHIVAHSLGGLVGKSYLNLCNANNSCVDMISFASISSPFAGVESAQYGVDYAPVAIPAWHDLVPESELVSELFNVTNTPPHLLNFGYKVSGVLNKQSSDGVINLSSQLAFDAQAQAYRIRGYNNDHVSILANPKLATELMLFWQQIEQGYQPENSY
ncbi:lipase family alpha/beta hydrolase [Shewanella waksmanii]|uniref:lipase family alpha/beta hydrolase n=1 Tax=Shewanella waksmanii TaxID=213783 RepID=UPI003736D813